MLKNEVERLVLLRFLEVENNLESGATSFAQPKPKLNQIFFLRNFKNLNKQFRQKPYPMPKINGMLLKLYRFQYATPIDLNVVCYHIQLSKNTSNLCTMILP